MDVTDEFRALCAREQVLPDMGGDTLLSLMTSNSVRWYIRHEDLQTPENGVAYFGPFSEQEIGERINGPLADMFADSGDVDSVQLIDSEARLLNVNSREWWMEQEAHYEREAS
jgi:hypothetical protein